MKQRCWSIVVGSIVLTSLGCSSAPSNEGTASESMRHSHADAGAQDAATTSCDADTSDAGATSDADTGDAGATSDADTGDAGATGDADTGDAGATGDADTGDAAATGDADTGDAGSVSDASDAGSGGATPSGPVAGPTYTGGYSIDGQTGVVISGANFTNANGACLTITNSSNVTIKGSTFIGCHGPGIDVENTTNVVIEYDYFEDINHGVFALGGSSLVVDYNNFKNLNFYTDNSPHFVIFDQVSGGANDVSFNRGINVQGQSSPEDLVNMYQSNGTASQPIMIRGNCFEGGGPSTSGGGIMAGDSSGTYITVQDNVLVNPGQYGIAVAAGSNNQLLNNKIYAAQAPWTNVGMYCGHGDSNTFSGNQVDYTNSSGQANPWWGGSCTNTQLSNNDFNTSLSSLSCALY